jgi:hypothetical protein
VLQKALTSQNGGNSQARRPNSTLDNVSENEADSVLPRMSSRTVNLPTIKVQGNISSKHGIEEMMVPPRVHVSPAKSDFAMP